MKMILAKIFKRSIKASLLLLVFFQFQQISVAEDYRSLAHNIGDLSQSLKTKTKVGVILSNAGLLLTSSLGITLPALAIPSLIVLNVTPFGIGTAITVAVGLGLGSLKIYQSLKSKPYYTMAEIMEYIHGSEREKDQEEFLKFFLTLKIKNNESPEDIKEKLKIISQHKLLDGHPTAQDLKQMFETGIFDMAIKNNFYNDVTLLHHIFKKVFLAAKTKKLHHLLNTPQMAERILRDIDQKLVAFFKSYEKRKLLLGQSDHSDLLIELFPSQKKMVSYVADQVKKAEKVEKPESDVVKCPKQPKVDPQDLASLQRACEKVAYKLSLDPKLSTFLPGKPQ